MTDMLSSDTSIALLQASQPSSAKAAETLQKAADSKNMERIEDAAREFESVFLTEMMKPMFEGVMKPDPMFGGGKGEEVFSGFMLQEYGKMMADRGGIGIADAVKQELIRIQESQNTGATLNAQ